MASATVLVNEQEGDDQYGSVGSSPGRAPVQRWGSLVFKKEPMLDEQGNEKHELARALLVERLELERALYSGLRMIVLCATLFMSLISTLHYQTDKQAQFALQQSYEDAFDLASASNIVAAHQLRAQLREVSAQVRTLQVLSSEFFVETEGQLKILGGIKDFDEAQVLEVAGLMPRIDSASFSLIAWVQKPSVDSSGYILRKPLGRGQESSLSCYGWYLGRAPRMDFGAHDVGLEDRSVDEESVTAGGEWEVDDAFHLEMIVVNRTTISFYRDAVLRSSLPLRRPVTDCSGGTLMLGDKGLRLAEVTFYARALSPTEISEIFFAGFPFEAIAAGKVPFQPHETEFDRLLGAQDEAVSTLLTSQAAALAQAAVGRVLTQALIQELQDGAGSPIPTVAGVSDPGCVSEWPPCQHIRNVTGAQTADVATGHQYYNLIPAEARNGAGPQDRLAVPAKAREAMLAYEAATFPSWEGQSCSFSVWVKPTVLGYLLAKSPGHLQNVMCWSLYVDPTWGIGTQGDATTPDGGWVYPRNMMRWGGSLEVAGVSPIDNNGQKYRHLAWVFDAGSNSLRTFVDGSMVGDQAFAEAGTVERLDCAVTNETYIGFANRAPGGLPFVGEIQDFRMYVGTALTNAEVYALSEGEGSSAERECSLSTEGQDSNYKDMNGNNCAWYQEAMSDTEAVCTASSVRSECPVACGTQEPCFESATSIAPTYQIWEKIMRLQPKIEGLGSMCVRDGFDAVGACMAAMARSDPHSYPPDGSAWSDRFQSLAEGGLGEWNVTDCMLLAAMVDPSCSFKVAGDWTRSFDAEAQASGQWTMSFWMKGSKDAAQLGVGVDMWMTMYSSVAPPVPLLRIVSYYGILLFQVWGRPDCERWNEDINMMVGYEAGKWVHMALTFGAPRGADGQRHIQLVKDAEYVLDLTNRQWCPPSTGEFVQAISVMHAFETLLTPIQVTARALSVKSLQLQYYTLRPAYRWRRGPNLAEVSRHSRPVTYKQNQFDAPGALLAPPILLQRRLQSASQCAAASGTDFQGRVWRDATHGMTCSLPYQCSDQLLQSSSELLTCRGTEISEMFLGRTPLRVRGQDVFAEFLPSIADASILVRDGQLFETSKFIDTQTESLVLPVVLFAPNVGVLTLISMEATFTSRVNVKYSVKQFQAVEGDALSSSLRQAALTLVLVGLSVIELAIEFASLWRTGEGRRLKLLLADLVVLAIMPVLYLSMRIGQLEDSANIMAKATGDYGLGGVPWASTSLPLDEKMDRFFAALEELQGHIDREQRMHMLGFVAAVVLLIRVILATQAHPRTAVLVTTIIAAADDLWHFCLLFLVLFVGFGALAYVSFGMHTVQFHSMAATFETLFDMMLGSLPRGGASRSQSWTSDPLLIIFVALFNFLVFFVMLNFIIAIIVESYLYTKKRLEDELTEQEFITDIIASMRALIKRLMLQWPSNNTLIKTLGDSEKDSVDEAALAELFPSWDRASIRKFIAHYEEYDFLSPENLPALKKLEGADLVNEIEQRVQNIIRQAAHAHAPSTVAKTPRLLEDPPNNPDAVSDAKPAEIPTAALPSTAGGWTEGEISAPTGNAAASTADAAAAEALEDASLLPNVPQPSKEGNGNT